MSILFGSRILFCEATGWLGEIVGQRYILVITKKLIYKFFNG